MFGIFRRHCPDCGTVQQAGRCLECDESSLTAQRRYLSQRRGSSLSENVDIGVLVDRTGSSAAFSKGVVVATETVLRIVENNLPDSRAWVQTHGDEDYGEFPELLAGPGPVEQTVKAVRSICFDGGGDAEETHLSGVEAAIGHLGCFASQSDRRQAMLVFLTDDTKPARSGHTAEAIGSRLKQLGVLFYLICQPTPSLRQLCTAADGLCFEISNNPTEEMLHEIASQIAGSVPITRACASGRCLSATAAAGLFCCGAKFWTRLARTPARMAARWRSRGCEVEKRTVISNAS